MPYYRRSLLIVVGYALLGGPSIHAEPPQANTKQVAGDRPARTDLYGDPLPARAVARLGTARFRHGGYKLLGLAFQADGKALIGATREAHLIQFWETQTGRLLREISTGTLSVRGFTLSPDGNYAAVAGFYPFDQRNPPTGALRILDITSGKEVRTLPRDARDAGQCALAFTPDGKLMLSMGGNGVLRIEEIASGVEILQQQFPRDIAANLTMSPDSSILAVASGPNTHKLYLWKWQSGEEPSELEVPPYGARLLSFSPDGKTLVACADHDGTIRLWDVASKKLRRTLIPPEHVSMSQGLAFSPDGKVLAINDYGNRAGRNFSGGVILWDLVAGKILRELPTPGEIGGAVAISADSRWIAAGTQSGVHVWDLRTGEEVAANPAAHHGTITRLVVSAQGLIATASDDHTVRIWDATTGRQRLKLTHGHWVRAVALSPDGTKLACSSLDDTVHLWDTATGREIYKLAGHGASGGNRALGFTPDGKQVLSWGDDFYLRVWDVANGKALVEHALRPSGVIVPNDDDERSVLRKLEAMGKGTFSANGKILVLSLSNNFHVFDVPTGHEVHKIAYESGYLSFFAISPDSKLLVASAWGKPVQTKLPGGGVRFSPANEHPICLWDLSSGKLLRKILVSDGGPGSVAFSPDGKVFAMGSEQAPSKIRLWEVATGGERLTIEGFRGGIRSLAFSPDGKRLVSGMSDTTALVWDISSEH